MIICKIIIYQNVPTKLAAVVQGSFCTNVVLVNSACYYFT